MKKELPSSTNASHPEILIPISSPQLVYWACLASLASCYSGTFALRLAQWKPGRPAGRNAPVFVHRTAGLSVTLLWEGLSESHLSASQPVFTSSLFVLCSPHICLQLAISLLIATRLHTLDHSQFLICGLFKLPWINIVIAACQALWLGKSLALRGPRCTTYSLQSLLLT